MKKKIEILVRRLSVAVQHNPAEVVLAVLFCMIGCMAYERQDNSLMFVVAYSPAFFLVTYTLNSLTEGRRWRFVYYLSVLLFLPFWEAKFNNWDETYWVTLVVVQLLYLVSGWKRENDAFVRNGLHYLRSGFSAVLLAGVAWVLSLSIYYSIRYIFEIWSGGESRYITYSLSFAFLGIMPLLFLAFNQDREEEGISDRLFHLLLNYVLSPALLIYAAILYLYFLKITVLWSLPKGAVAYIVVSFVSATFILKGCQVFLEKRYYGWFFRHASFAVLPALVMYWVGTFYRINQYGYTESRVYLVIVGIILTSIALLFFSHKLGRYLYSALIAIVLLSAVTYIPGITAKDIERISQTKRGNYPIKTFRYDDYSYINLRNSYPVDLSGYQTLIPINTYGSEGFYSRVQGDSLFLYDKQENVFFREDLQVLFERQTRKAGLQLTDSLTQEMDPAIFHIDLDSAAYIVGEISASRSPADSIYRASYMGGGYYLKKSVSLPLPNK